MRVDGRRGAEVGEGVGLQGAGDTRRCIFVGVPFVTDTQRTIATVYKGAEGSQVAEKTRNKTGPVL